MKPKKRSQREVDLGKVLFGTDAEQVMELLKSEPIDDTQYEIEEKMREHLGIIHTGIETSFENAENYRADALEMFFKSMQPAFSEGDRNYAGKQSAHAAGEYVRMCIEKGNLRDIRNFLKSLEKIKAGGIPRKADSAIVRVGNALLSFINEKKRLPTSRLELKLHPSENSIFGGFDIAKIGDKSMSDALAHFGLNKKIRDKTGPVSGK